jgi:DNA invertase Pin-like site-specific DNA recombinase
VFYDKLENQYKPVHKKRSFFLYKKRLTILFKENDMIYGYIRVSTDKQTVQNQKYEIQKFCGAQKLRIDYWVCETISSQTALEKRKLGKLLKKLQKDDIIIASELSRLGRNLLQIMSILNFCLNQGVQIWTLKDNYRLGQDIQSKILAFAFSLSAEIERNLISQRTQEALQRLKSDGVVLGRPQGHRNATCKLMPFKQQIAAMIQLHYSKSAIARLLGCHRVTLVKFIEREMS